MNNWTSTRSQMRRSRAVFGDKKFGKRALSSVELVDGRESAASWSSDTLFSGPSNLSQNVVLGTQENFRLLSPLALLS